MIFRLALSTALVGGFAAAQPPHWQFVAGLRERGMPELALDYLRQRSQDPSHPQGPQLFRELAVTLVAVADQEEDAVRRFRRLSEARVALDRALTFQLPVSESTEIRFQVVRLLSREIRERAALALSSDANAERDAVASHKLRDEAASRLRGIRREVENALGATADSAIRLLAEVELDENELRLLHAATLNEPTREQRLRRVEEVKAAQTAFRTLAEKNPGTSMGWSALVWVGRCALELEDRAEAKKTLEMVSKESGPAAFDARRIARYWLIRMSDEDPYSRSRPADVIRGCEEWLSSYPRSSRSSEGIGVEYLLAVNLIRLAQTGMTPPRHEGAPPILSPATRAQLRRAEKLLQGIEQPPTEFTTRARRLRADVIGLLISGRAAQGLDSVSSFEECYWIAQAELSRAVATNEQRIDELRQAMKFLDRAVSFAGPTDPVRDVMNARLMLCDLLLKCDEPYSAAVLGEHLSRTAGSSKGARAASCALRAYSAILNRSRQRGASQDEIRGDQARIRLIAERIVQQWPDDTETDHAHFALGTLLVDEKQWSSAFEHFSRVRDGASDAAAARRWQAVIALQPLPKDTREQVITRAISDLERLPTPRSSGDAVACQAKLLLAELYLQRPAPDFEHSISVARGIKKLCPTEATDAATLRLRVESDRRLVSALVAKAGSQAARGHLEAALDTLGPVEAEIIEAGAGQSQMTFDETYRGAVEEIIRLKILSGSSPDLAPFLRLLKKDDSITGGPSNRPLSLRLIADVTAHCEAASGDRQRAMINSLLTLVDALASKNDLTAEERLVLAKGLSAAGKHDRSIKLLTPITRPEDANERGMAMYRFARLQLAREYRLSKAYTEAKATLREVIGTPSTKGWGYDNIDVRREAVELMHDEGNFGGVVRMSQEVQAGLLPLFRENEGKSPRSDPVASSARGQFFEFYYFEARALAHHALRQQDDKATEAVRRFCIRLVKLEKSYPDLGGDAVRARFQRLVDTNEAFSRGYADANGQVLQRRTTDVRP